MSLRAWILTLFLVASASAQVVPRLSWFNPRDRLVAVDSERPLELSLHTPEGRWIQSLQPSRLRGQNVYEISADIPSGLYLLRIRCQGGERLERVLLF